jgi:hypothetical protein
MLPQAAALITSGITKILHEGFNGYVMGVCISKKISVFR